MRLILAGCVTAVLAMSGCVLYEASDEGDQTDVARPAGDDDPTVDGQCVEACQLIADCGDVDPHACHKRCRDSLLLEDRGEPIRCLALRVFWIDEEGCAAIEQAYVDFDPADDCSD